MIKRDRGNNNNYARGLTLLRIQTQIANPTRDQQPHVTIPQMILPDRFEERLRHALLRHWNFQADRASRIPQTIQMFSQPENAPIIKTNPLENSVAVQQAVVEDRDFCVRLGVKFSVDVNLRFLNSHRGGAPATLDCRFNYCVRSRLMNFGFL